MPCDRTQDIHAYHDGELTAERSADVERHLATCAACQRELASLRRVSVLVRSATMTSPSQMTMQRLARGLRRTQEQSVRRLAGWLTAAAAAVVLVATATRPEASRPAPGGPGVDLLALETSSVGEPLPETLLAARWIAMDLDVASAAGSGKVGR